MQEIGLTRGKYEWPVYVTFLSIYLSTYLSNIEFRVHMNVFFLLFLCPLMYIKVLPVLELFKGAVTVVIIALEPPFFPDLVHLLLVR